MTDREVVAIDLFCGAGGLTYGLQKAGITVVAGIDLDPACEYPFVSNNGSRFIMADIRDIELPVLRKLYPSNAIRVLAGCAPCRPFSSLQRRAKKSRNHEWGLLGEFARLAKGLMPQIITMENVPRLASHSVFREFVDQLEEMDYHVDYKSVYGPRLGLPQQRRRLVLLASRLGVIEVPAGARSPEEFKTVRQVIGSLPSLTAGQKSINDRLHRARTMSDTNLKRVRSSRPGGTWKDWPEDLKVDCHRTKKGSSFKSVYGRMEWDRPSPTITTQSHNFGTGRFGHPDQDRALSLREAAMLQTFPRRYRFVEPGAPIHFATVGRLIGNAVPPMLGEVVGREIMRAVSAVSA